MPTDFEEWQQSPQNSEQQCAGASDLAGGVGGQHDELQVSVAGASKLSGQVQPRLVRNFTTPVAAKYRLTAQLR